MGICQESRNEQIASEFSTGATSLELARRYGVSSQRIFQILKRRGIQFGGVAYRTSTAGTSDNRRLIANKYAFLSYYGCTREQARSLSTVGQRRAYSFQRHSALRRGVGWEMNLIQWLLIWEESGKLEQRGRRGHKYVMARKGDEGPYATDNVYITTFSGNLKDYWLWARPLKKSTS
jgi:hypothetical protein